MQRVTVGYYFDYRDVWFYTVRTIDEKTVAEHASSGMVELDVNGKPNMFVISGADAEPPAAKGCDIDLVVELSDEKYGDEAFMADLGSGLERDPGWKEL